MRERGRYCACGGCRFVIDEEGSPEFTSQCREARGLLAASQRVQPWTEEGYALHVAYMEHTREAWPKHWFAADGHYITSAEWAERHRTEAQEAEHG